MNNDLISRSALLEEFDWFNRACANDGANETAAILVRLVENAPAVDAEPVRHGRWTLNHAADFECSECRYENTWETAYCPNCGAKITNEKVRDLKPCDSCEHYEWDMPQCKECNPENRFKWHKRK